MTEGMEQQHSIPTDESLANRAKRGDVDAFDALFSRYSRQIRNRLARILPANVGRKVSVADVLQEVRIAALRGCADFEVREGNSFRNWVLTIADNLARSVVRQYAGTAKRDVGREVTRGMRAETGQFLAKQPSPCQHAMASETADRIQRALLTLSDDHREVIRLTREEGLPLCDAARQMARSVDAIKKLLARALIQLKDSFDRTEAKRHD
jgi:RNA polymerase sigma-70 factor (ECF subfamily)